MYMCRFENIDGLKEYTENNIDRDIKENPVIQYECSQIITKLDAEEIVQKVFSEIKEGENDVMVQKITKRFDFCEGMGNIQEKITEVIQDLKKRYGKMPYFVYIRKLHGATYETSILCVMSGKGEKNRFYFCRSSV